MCLWRQNQVSQTWSSPNQVVYVPKPNHPISTALRQHKIEEMLSCNMKKHKFSTHQMSIFNISVVWTDIQSQHIFWRWGGQDLACFRRHALLSYPGNFLAKVTIHSNLEGGLMRPWSLLWPHLQTFIPKTSDKQSCSSISQLSSCLWCVIYTHSASRGLSSSPVEK